MEGDGTKLFVGGITRETSEEVLRAHFGKYGTVLGSLVARDRVSGVCRGFGFVWFSDASMADKALQDSHVILGRTVEVKKAKPKHEQLQYQQQQQHQQRQHPDQQKINGFGKNSNGDGNGSDSFRTKKIFVGGLPASLTEQQFKDYFERFGRIVDVVVMQDSSTNRPRGFGFVTFESEESVEKVLEKSAFHYLVGRPVEVKRAVPKDGTNGANNSYVARGGLRGSSNWSYQPGNYHLYAPGCEIYPSYAPHPGYMSAGGYLYGSGIYGDACPMIGYGRPSVGIAPMDPGSVWSVPVMIGAGQYSMSYNNAYAYPSYMNGGFNVMSTLNNYNGIGGPSVNGKSNQVLGGNEHLQPNANDSSSLRSCNGGASS